MNITMTIRKLILVFLLFSLPMTLTSCGGNSGRENPSIFGVGGPEVDLVNGNFVLTVALENINTDVGITFPFKNYPNSSLFVGPDFASGGTLLIFTISLDDYERYGFRKFDPKRLPGGRSLPGVAGGVLPSASFTWDRFPNTRFYVGENVLGVFIPVPGLDLGGIIATYRFYDIHGVRIGNISLVGEDDNGENAGVLVLINIDLRIQRAMNRQLSRM